MRTIRGDQAANPRSASNSAVPDIIRHDLGLVANEAGREAEMAKKRQRVKGQADKH